MMVSIQQSKRAFWVVPPTSEVAKRGLENKGLWDSICERRVTDYGLSSMERKWQYKIDDYRRHQTRNHSLIRHNKKVSEVFWYYFSICRFICQQRWFLPQHGLTCGHTVLPAASYEKYRSRMLRYFFMFLYMVTICYSPRIFFRSASGVVMGPML